MGSPVSRSPTKRERNVSHDAPLSFKMHIIKINIRTDKENFLIRGLITTSTAINANYCQNHRKEKTVTSEPTSVPLIPGPTMNGEK